MQINKQLSCVVHWGDEPEVNLLNKLWICFQTPVVSLFRFSSVLSLPAHCNLSDIYAAKCKQRLGTERLEANTACPMCFSLGKKMCGEPTWPFRSICQNGEWPLEREAARTPHDLESSSGWLLTVCHVRGRELKGRVWFFLFSLLKFSPWKSPLTVQNHGMVWAQRDPQSPSVQPPTVSRDIPRYSR